MNSQHRLPAEWEEQSGVLITWPHHATDWVASLAAIEQFFSALAVAIIAHEKLLVIAYDEPHEKHISQLLQAQHVDSQRLIFLQAETNDTWTRDYGPLFLTNGNKVHCLDFAFNAWGNKFTADKDNVINRQLLENKILNCTESITHSFVLEGGSIDCDGAGTLLTTKHCLLNKNRNPDFTAAQISEFIIAEFNLRAIHWLSEGLIVGDDTDSHIDMLARFTDSNTIVHASCDDPNDAHYLPLQKMQQELKTFKTASGGNYQLHALPIPAAILDDEGNRLPASYANFLIINQAVLLPTYADPCDETAINVLQSCFPDRTIIPIDARAAITQGGSLHCLTMQLINGALN